MREGAGKLEAGSSMPGPLGLLADCPYAPKLAPQRLRRLVGIALLSFLAAEVQHSQRAARK